MKESGKLQIEHSYIEDNFIGLAFRINIPENWRSIDNTFDNKEFQYMLLSQDHTFGMLFDSRQLFPLKVCEYGKLNNDSVYQMTSYKEIDTDLGKLRIGLVDNIRDIDKDVQNEEIFLVCQQNEDGTWKNITKIGHISLGMPLGYSIDQIEPAIKILESIKITSQ